MVRIPEKVFCKQCRGNTNHSVLENDGIALKYTQKHSEYNSCNHYIVKCDGCDTISFLRQAKYKNEANVEKVIYNLYPDPMQRMDELELPVLLNVPPSVEYIITEVHVAYIQQMHLLCSIGLRMAIEAICNEKTIKGRSLNDKIETMRTSSIISDSQAKVLQQIRLIGNKAAHKITPLEQELLREGIKIINSILYSIYEIDKIHFE